MGHAQRFFLIMVKSIGVVHLVRQKKMAIGLWKSGTSCLCSMSSLKMVQEKTFLTNLSIQGWG